MTQLRTHDPRELTNYFDAVLSGIGHRGSSFTDMDRMDAPPVVLTQDDRTSRILIQEFKREREVVNVGQFRALSGLARITDLIEVWIVVKLDRANYVSWRSLRADAPKVEEVISIDEYRRRFAHWWGKQPASLIEFVPPPPPSDRNAVPLLTADDIGSW